MANKFPWTESRQNSLIVHQAGTISDIGELLDAISGSIDLSKIKALCKAEYQQFGIIVENDDCIFAAVDRVRSFPIFYNIKTHEVTYDDFALKATLTFDVEPNAMLQFCMAGYILGSDTLYEDFKNMQAGEYLLLDKHKRTLKVEEYYQYIPNPQNITKTEAIQTLDKVIDRAIQRTINQASGHKIWVPLSGGLDSRIVAAKLKQHDYGNVTCFSYGVKNNDEAKTAQKVAKLLDLPWFLLPSDSRKARDLYNSDIRDQYEKSAHRLSAMPTYVEFEAIHTLKTLGYAQDGDYIVNGQSGDFLAGAHIPAVLYGNDNPDIEDMMDFILQKHFSLWENLKTLENVEILTKAVTDSLPGTDQGLSAREQMMAQYESFEWRERQCKMVVHGQRIYDFFGLNWSLPLWDGELMNFFEKLPFDMKYKRQLFIEYAQTYNYCNVFDLPTAQIKVWRPPFLYFIVAIGQMLRFVKGKDSKDDFYKKMSYYGHAHNQFAIFGRSLFLRHYKDLRNMISLSTLDFCQRYNLPFPKS